MQLSIRVPDHAVRVAATLAIGIAALLLGGWWAGQARAAHNPGSTVHACAAPNGSLRLVEQCRNSESPLVLATEAGLQAAESRIAALQADNATLEDRVEELEVTVSEQATTISGLEGDVTTLESANTALQGRVDDLEGLLAGATRSQVDGRDTLRFTGMNVQLVNGTDRTNGEPNGLGNLIIGYNAPRATGTDTAVDRAGSHYLVVGDQHHWTRFGGILVGHGNTSTGDYASAAGQANDATGDYASVSGGIRNTASGDSASVSGGFGNTASHDWTSILGGLNNTVDVQGSCHPAC